MTPERLRAYIKDLEKKYEGDSLKYQLMIKFSEYYHDVEDMEIDEVSALDTKAFLEKGYNSLTLPSPYSELFEIPISTRGMTIGAMQGMGKTSFCTWLIYILSQKYKDKHFVYYPYEGQSEEITTKILVIHFNRNLYKTLYKAHKGLTDKFKREYLEYEISYTDFMRLYSQGDSDMMEYVDKSYNDIFSNIVVPSKCYKAESLPLVSHKLKEKYPCLALEIYDYLQFISFAAPGRDLSTKQTQMENLINSLNEKNIEIETGSIYIAQLNPPENISNFEKHHVLNPKGTRGSRDLVINSEQFIGLWDDDKFRGEYKGEYIEGLGWHNFSVDIIKNAKGCLKRDAHLQFYPKSGNFFKI